MGLDFQKVQGHVRVRFQVEIHRALARAGLAVVIMVRETATYVATRS